MVDELPKVEMNKKKFDRETLGIVDEIAVCVRCENVLEAEKIARRIWKEEL